MFSLHELQMRPDGARKEADRDARMEPQPEQKNWKQGSQKNCSIYGAFCIYMAFFFFFFKY